MLIERGSTELPTVLVIDDEIEVLESLADVLRREFHVLATTDPGEALKLLEAHDVAVVLCDQRIGPSSGTELLVQASSLCPETVRILFSGYADIEAVIQSVNDAKVYYYLAKPWDNARILELIRSAVRTHSLAGEERRLLRELARLGKETALLGLRNDLVRDHEDGLSMRVSHLRAATARLQATYSQLKQIEERVPFCLSCARIRTPDATWSDLASFLKASGALSGALCPECSNAAGPSPGAGPEEGPAGV